MLWVRLWRKQSGRRFRDPSRCPVFAIETRCRRCYCAKPYGGLGFDIACVPVFQDDRISHSHGESSWYLPTVVFGMAVQSTPRSRSRTRSSGAKSWRAIRRATGSSPATSPRVSGASSRRPRTASAARAAAAVPCAESCAAVMPRSPAAWPARHRPARASRRALCRAGTRRRTRCARAA